MTVGDRIRERRKELNLTQAELGKKLGWGKSAVCRVENEGNNITTDRITKIANALEVSPSYLMGWDEEELYLHISHEEFEDKISDVFLDLGYSYYRLVKSYYDFSSDAREELMNYLDYLTTKYNVQIMSEEEINKLYY